MRATRCDSRLRASGTTTPITTATDAARLSRAASVRYADRPRTTAAGALLDVLARTRTGAAAPVAVGRPRVPGGHRPHPVVTPAAMTPR